MRDVATKVHYCVDYCISPQRRRDHRERLYSRRAGIAQKPPQQSGGPMKRLAHSTERAIKK
jgi:hypothetical protein